MEADQAPPPPASISAPAEEIRGRMEMLEKQVKDLELASGGKQQGARGVVEPGAEPAPGQGGSPIVPGPYSRPHASAHSIPPPPPPPGFVGSFAQAAGLPHHHPHFPGGMMHYMPAEHPASSVPYDIYAPAHHLHAPPPGAEGLDWQQRPYPLPPFSGVHHSQSRADYFDAGMMEDYRTKMDALHMHFNSALRPKLEALKRQIVTVESRINDVSSARDLLLAEAVAEHQVHVDQVHLCSERKFSLLRGDLDELMRDVQRIYAFTSSLSQPQPKSSAEVMSFMSRYMDLQAQCSQLSSKGFKTQIDVDPADLRLDVASMLSAINPSKLVAHGNSSSSSSAQKTATGGASALDSSKAKKVEEAAPPAGAGGASGELEEMTKLVQVKDQMVWMMLKERKELQDKLEAQTASYKALEEAAFKEQEEWKKVCEGLKQKLDDVTKENGQLKEGKVAQGAAV